MIKQLVQKSNTLLKSKRMQKRKTLLQPGDVWRVQTIGPLKAKFLKVDILENNSPVPF